jgi:hypothetical protein
LFERLLIGRTRLDCGIDACRYVLDAEQDVQFEIGRLDFVG